MLFGIMLTQRLDVPPRERHSWVFVLPGIVAGFLIMGGLVYLALGVPWKQVEPAQSKFVGREIGATFMSTFILPFEAVSILLLVAMVGASYLARGRDEGEEKEITRG
jgi:NADH-quinone oxidoreductase subunit J